MYLFESSTAAAHKGKVYKNTMIRYKNKLYLASATGALYKGGWRQYNNGWYYLRNYTPLTNQFRKKKGVLPVWAWMSTGMPRPLSTTVMVSPSLMVTEISVQ